MKTVIIVQARIGSSRLPGKVLKEVNGKTLLEHLIVRLRRVRKADQIVVATTIKEEDLPIVDLCKKLDVAFYRGSEEDVLSRYYEAALQYKGDLIVRVTSDCPLIDPSIVDKALTFYIENHNEIDYVSNNLKQTYPKGMDVEIFPFSILKEAHEEAKREREREHVTPFIKYNPIRYRLSNIEYSENFSHYRWTVDTSEDLHLITKILNTLYNDKPEFTMKDIVSVMKSNPEWISINAHI